MLEETPKKQRAGRKRDPHIEPRAMRAVMEVYAQYGWQGFTFESVSRVSGIGKPAIYRRWSSREELLIQAFDSVNFPTANDKGSLRSDLEDYVAQWIEWYRTPFLPEAGSRILVDCAANATLEQLYGEVIAGPRGALVRQITHRAIARQELPENTSATFIPDLLLGAFFIHWAFSSDKGSARFCDALTAYGERLIHTVLTGTHATPID